MRLEYVPDAHAYGHGLYRHGDTHGHQEGDGGGGVSNYHYGIGKGGGNGPSAVRVLNDSYDHALLIAAHGQKAPI